jgi:hypothetical protein
MCCGGIQDLDVRLSKPPEEYNVGEELIIEVNGRDVAVRVEELCRDDNKYMYVR